MSEQLSNATVLVNNDVVAIVPNSLMYTEGLGEQNIRTASAGGNQTEQVYANNVEMLYSTVKFDMMPTVENIGKLREWKLNKDQNLVQVMGQTSGGELSRTFAQAALISNYEVNLTSDGNISLEWRTKPAV